MASELRVNTLKDAAGNNSIGMSYVANGSAKAWVNWNGTGTVAIRGSLNVASISDDGTGAYTINFSSALADANASVVGMGVHDGGSYVTEPFVDNDATPITTARIKIDALQPNTLSNVDGAHLYISTNGDLA
jgi:hypothetical protein